MKKKIVLKNLEDTMSFGKSLALSCFGGEIFAVSGPLGSGKTSLAQGFARGFKIRNRVNSPTFNIIKIYKVVNNQSIKEFVHIDAYRLKSSIELLSLGVEDFFNSKESVVFIEWADKIEDILPAKAKKIKIDYFKNKSARLIYF